MMATRPYRLQHRAERQEETRRRIIDAAIALHESVGPMSTSVSDIAERAGVGRVTVYRHFPDEATLARACSGIYFARNPVPDPERWTTIADSAERLRAGLTEVYAYHRTTQAMMAKVLAEARDHPVMEAYHEHWRRATEVLLAPWRARGRRRTLLRAGIALALSFDTWRALVRDQGLTDEQAVQVATRLTGA
jgi:AcrR family transcriptional regulator